jgi:hypothetical protein
VFSKGCLDHPIGGHVHGAERAFSTLHDRLTSAPLPARPAPTGTQTR